MGRPSIVIGMGEPEHLFFCHPGESRDPWCRTLRNIIGVLLTMRPPNVHAGGKVDPGLRRDDNHGVERSGG
jgi:hypothetical protein